MPQDSMQTNSLNSALAFQLSRPDWTLFFSGTSPGGTRVEGVSLRVRRAHALVRITARESGISLDRALWVLREELGEIGGRPHIHGLLYLGKTANPVSAARWVSWLWSTKLGGGFSRCTPYDSRLAGADYITKNLGGSNETSGARQYEARKFDIAERVTLSWGLQRLLRSLNGHSRFRPTLPKGGEEIPLVTDSALTDEGQLYRDGFQRHSAHIAK